MKTIVIGIGNPYVKNDSVGIEVAERLRNKLDVELFSTTSIDIIYSIMGYDKAIFVDSLSCEGIHLVDVKKSAYTNTHNINLQTMLKIGFELFPDEMPEILIIGVGNDVDIDKILDLITYEVCFSQE